MDGRKRVIIENVKPQINHGLYPLKRIVKDKVNVSADIFCDGHDSIRAELLYRHAKEKNWHINELTQKPNDSWSGYFLTDNPGEYIYTLQGWVDRASTWFYDIMKKIQVEVEIKSDIEEGIDIIQSIFTTYKSLEQRDTTYLKQVSVLFSSNQSLEEKTEPIINNKLFGVLLRYPLRNYITTFEPELKVIAERPKARFSTWYEFFPRSLIGEVKNHGTFKDCISRLEYIADMGFDIVYLPPIHPIGETKKKGKNNTPEAMTGDPGSPWAIGSKDGGHKAVHKKLGTLDDFKELVLKAKEYNIEIALDIALQCSPDHPYLKEHPKWFRHRSDGTIQYAENPPKKYEDIYPFDFESDDWEALWNELKSIFTFWIEQGVKIFRVDNPHTKSIRFWGWLITEVQKEHPDVIFLAEAFTRPKVMYQLAKQGFTQSYTYFTWRNTKRELITYFEELTHSDIIEYFRPNLWPNTPDILPEFLQVSGKPGFIIRSILAATLSASYGIYGPAFELMENIPNNYGSEEYLNSEKYEIKDWDIHAKNSLKPLLKRVNRIRHDNPALHNNRSLRFYETENENLLAYSKSTEDFSNIILVVVNLDPYHTHSGWIHFPVADFDVQEHESYQAHDLLGGSFYLWNGIVNFVELNPGVSPAHIFSIRRKVRTERDFDYFL